MVVMGLMGGAAVLQPLGCGLSRPANRIVYVYPVHRSYLHKDREGQRYTRAVMLNTYADVEIAKKAGEEQYFKQLRKYDRIRNLVHYLHHPFESFISNVNNTLYITVPIAILYITAVLLNVPHYADPELFIDVVDDHIIIAGLIVLIPYAIFYRLWARKVNGIQALIPDFLDRLAGINRSASRSRRLSGSWSTPISGSSAVEIHRIKRDMDWGVNFTEALDGLSSGSVHLPLPGRSRSLQKQVR